MNISIVKQLRSCFGALFELSQIVEDEWITARSEICQQIAVYSNAVCD